jgi:hypothetical protein
VAVDVIMEIREICDHVLPFVGGHGAVRDIWEYVLKRDGKYVAFVHIKAGVLMSKLNFNTAGPCVPGEHYMLDPLRGVGMALIATLLFVLR